MVITSISKSTDMEIHINGEKYPFQIINQYMISVVLPSGKRKSLSRDADRNWIFDVNDNDFMLAHFLGSKIVEMCFIDGKQKPIADIKEGLGVWTP